MGRMAAKTSLMPPLRGWGFILGWLFIERPRLRRLKTKTCEAPLTRIGPFDEGTAPLSKNFTFAWFAISIALPFAPAGAPPCAGGHRALPRKP